MTSISSELQWRFHAIPKLGARGGVNVRKIKSSVRFSGIPTNTIAESLGSLCSSRRGIRTTETGCGTSEAAFQFRELEAEDKHGGERKTRARALTASEFSGGFGDPSGLDSEVTTGRGRGTGQRKRWASRANSSDSEA